MSSTWVHDYAQFGKIDALKDHISMYPNDINAKGYVSRYYVTYMINNNLIIII